MHRGSEFKSFSRGINLSEKTHFYEFLDTRIMQPVAMIPREQKENINAISDGCDKVGAVCNDCLGQSVNRSIKCYYCSR